MAGHVCTDELALHGGHVRVECVAAALHLPGKAVGGFSPLVPRRRFAGALKQCGCRHAGQLLPSGPCAAQTLALSSDCAGLHTLAAEPPSSSAAQGSHRAVLLPAGLGISALVEEVLVTAENEDGGRYVY